MVPVIEIEKSRKTDFHFLVDHNIESIQNCQDFIKQIRRMPLEPGAKIAIDFSRVSMCTGSFIRFLVEAVKFIRNQGADLIIVTNNKNILELFEFTGITKIVAVLPRLPSRFLVHA